MDEENSVICDPMKKMLEKEQYDVSIPEIRKHLFSICVECSLKKMKLRPPEQLLWTDRPPSWLQPEESTSNPTEAPQTAKKFTKAKKEIVKLSTPEEIDEHLLKLAADSSTSDNQLQHAVVKYKRLSKEAARQMAIQLRKKVLELGMRSLKSIEPKTKVVNERQQIPWCPPIEDIFPRDKFSDINNQEQSRIVAIIQSLIREGKLRFESNRDDLKAFMRKAEKERHIMEEEISVLYSRKKNFLSKLDKGLVAYSRNRLLKHWNNNDRFYDSSQKSEVDLEDSESSNTMISPQCTEVLNPGKYEKITLPNMANRCHLTDDKLEQQYPIKEANINPVYQDQKVMENCLESGVSLAMEASTACFLMTDDFITKPANYSIPIEIRTEVFRGEQRKIITLSKPCTFGEISRPAVKKLHTKYLVKSEFVKHWRTARLARSNNTTNGPSEPKHLEIAEEGEINERSSSGGDLDKVGDILAAIDSTSAPVPPSSPTDKRYALYSFGNYEVLIRGSPAMNVASNHPYLNGKYVSFGIVMECLPQVGASALHEEEIFWNYCKSIFKGADEHCLLRCLYNTDTTTDVLQIQPMLPILVQNRAEYEHNLRRMLNERTRRMVNILSHISQLDEGSHLLVKEQSNPLFTIPVKAQSSYNAFESPLHIEYDSRKMASSLNIDWKKNLSVNDIFFGIEPCITLQWQAIQHRAPGCFIASDSNMKRTLEKNLGRPNRVKGRPSKKRNGQKPQMKNNKRKRMSKEKTAPNVSYRLEEHPNDLDLSGDLVINDDDN